MKDIVISSLCKSYNGHAVLKDFSAVLRSGTVTGLMAPSGGGKTTLLRILMGLEQADSGSIEGMKGLRVSAVFQEDRLCEGLDAASNIRLVSPELSREQVQQALCAVGLEACGSKKVREFSGGMRRRVAILRALMAEYDFLLLDEPFQGLDEATRKAVMDDTRRRWAGRTVLLVTHDPAELEAVGASQCLHL